MPPRQSDVVYITPEVIEHMDKTNKEVAVAPSSPPTTTAKTSQLFGDLLLPTTTTISNKNNKTQNDSAKEDEDVSTIVDELYTYVDKLTSKSSKALLQRLSGVSNLKLKIDRNSHETFKQVMQKLACNKSIQKLELHRSYDKESKSKSSSNGLVDKVCVDNVEVDLVPNTKGKGSPRGGSGKSSTIIGTSQRTQSQRGVSSQSKRQHFFRRRTVKELRALFFVVRGLPHLKRLDLHHFGLSYLEDGITSVNERDNELNVLTDILLKDHPTLTTLHMHIHGSIPTNLQIVIGTLPKLKRLHLYLYQSDDYSHIISQSKTLKQLTVHPMKVFTYKLDHIKSIMDATNNSIMNVATGGSDIGSDGMSNMVNNSGEDVDVVVVADDLNDIEYSSRNQKSSSLEVLDFGGPDAKMTTSCAKAIAFALRDNTSLQRIAFSYNPTTTSTSNDVSSDGQQQNQTSHQHRKTPTEEAMSVLGELCCALCCNTTLISLKNHCSSRLNFTTTTTTTSHDGNKKKNKTKKKKQKKDAASSDMDDENDDYYGCGGYGCGSYGYGGGIAVARTKNYENIIKQKLIQRSIRNMIDSLRYNPSIIEFNFFNESMDISIQKHRAISLQPRYIINVVETVMEYMPSCCTW